MLSPSRAQWLGSLMPDPEGEHFQAVREALHQLCVLHDVAPNHLWVWIDYLCVPQAYI